MLKPGESFMVMKSSGKLSTEDLLNYVNGGGQMTAEEMRVLFADIKGKTPVPYHFPRRFRKGILKGLRDSLVLAKKRKDKISIKWHKDGIKAAKKAEKFVVDDYFSMVRINFIYRKQCIFVMK